MGAGETLGLVGESGSGKSTLARALLRLIPAARGTVMWRGVDLLSCDAATLRRQRRDLQMVFQDPLASLNPRMTVGETLAEPLEIFEPGLAARERAGADRGDAGTSRSGARRRSRRYPHEFSGGQCQRIGIARAMMLRPKLLVCDEPVSSLDVSIQGQIVNLLIDLQREFGTAMLFISHNLAVVRHLSHRVLVMYLGRIVEMAARDALFAAPAHPYTRALLAAVPDPTRAPAGIPRVADDNLAAAGEPPVGSADPSGCVFRNRCRYAEGICEREIPRLEPVSAQHAVACHRWRALAPRPIQLRAPCVNRALLESADAGHTILAPNTELAAALFDAIERAHRDSGREIWPTPRVRDFGGWLREQHIRTAVRRLIDAAMLDRRRRARTVAHGGARARVERSSFWTRRALRARRGARAEPCMNMRYPGARDRRRRQRGIAAVFGLECAIRANAAGLLRCIDADRLPMSMARTSRSPR